MMWRLLAKNSVITCSTMGGSEAVAAIVMWLGMMPKARSWSNLELLEASRWKVPKTENFVILEPLRQLDGKQNSQILGGLELRFDLRV